MNYVENMKTAEPNQYLLVYALDSFRYSQLLEPIPYLTQFRPLGTSSQNLLSPNFPGLCYDPYFSLDTLLLIKTYR